MSRSDNSSTSTRPAESRLDRLAYSVRLGSKADFSGMAASGAKRSFVVWDEMATEGLPQAVDATHLQHDKPKQLILLS